VKLEQENPWDASRSPPPLPALKAKLENRFYLFQKKSLRYFQRPNAIGCNEVFMF
jgi:hypothetical protein